MNKHIRAYIIWPLCLLFLGGLVLGNSGNVLCVSDGGHIKVESVCQSDPGDFEEVQILEHRSDVYEHHASCDDCTDVPLRFDSHAHRPTTQATNIGASLPDVLPLVTSPAVCPPTSVRACFPQDDTIVCVTQVLLSTTVLRC